jgi:uncharacterized protein YhdP
MVDAINAAIADRSIQNLKELAPAQGDETKFTRLGATAQIRNGIARNDDLAIEVPNLGLIAGKGSADLPQQRLDYRVTVGKIAVIAAGPFSALKFKPDVGAAAKQAAEKKVEQKVDKAKSRLLDKLKRK